MTHVTAWITKMRLSNKIILVTILSLMHLIWCNDCPFIYNLLSQVWHIISYPEDLIGSAYKTSVDPNSILSSDNYFPRRSASICCQFDFDISTCGSSAHHHTSVLQFSHSDQKSVKIVDQYSSYPQNFL